MRIGHRAWGRLRIADLGFEKNRDFSVGAAFPVLSLSKGSRDLSISTN